MTTNRSAPDSDVVPVLVYDDVAQAIDWLCSVFGFRERLRFERDGVVGHAQLDVGNGAVMLGQQGGKFRAPDGEHVSQYVHVTVVDADAHCERARQRGAKIVTPPSDKPFGERQYTARDPGGHWWTFSQHVADVAPEEWGAISAASASD